MAATRHGSRWLHEAPTEDEVKDWFGKQTLHEGMQHDPYVGGIVLINATEKVKVTKTKQNGEPYLQEQEQVVFVPYVKVDTRIAYFWDWVRVLNEGGVRGDFVGKIRPVGQRVIEDASSAYFNAHLPQGFSMLPVRNENNAISRFLVATYEVAIYERESWGRKVAGEEVEPLVSGVGSKQTTLARRWADDNAVMKAQTGAIGRALGVAGILVVGTGVATAEDMQEAAAGPSGPAAASGEGAVLPEVISGPEVGAGVPSDAPAGPAVEAETTAEDDDDALRTKALAMQAEMEKDHPEAWATYREWWAGRGFGRIADLSGPALSGATIKLERELDAARGAGA